MSGESQRNGVLAQCIEAFQNGTCKDASGLQKFLIATIVLVPLVLVLAVAVAVVAGVLKVNLAATLPWVGGGGALCGGVIAAARRMRRKRISLPAGTQPRQELGGDEAGGDGGEAAGQEGDEVRDGAG